LKKNNLIYGLILGFTMPFLGILLFYLWKASSTPLGEFLNVAFHTKVFLTAMISFSLFLNAIIFTWFVNKRIDKTAIGIFVATLVYALPVIIIKIWM
jgi:hypothetical protein